MTPTARSLAYLRDKGYKPGIVEKWIPMARRRIDLFGFIDLVAMMPGRTGLWGIQTTTQSNYSAHLKKYKDDQKILSNITDWLTTGNYFHYHLWAKRGGLGKRKTWTVKVVPVELKDLII